MNLSRNPKNALTMNEKQDKESNSPPILKSGVVLNATKKTQNKRKKKERKNSQPLMKKPGNSPILACRPHSPKIVKNRTKVQRNQPRPSIQKSQLWLKAIQKIRTNPRQSIA